MTQRPIARWETLVAAVLIFSIGGAPLAQAAEAVTSAPPAADTTAAVAVLDSADMVDAALTTGVSVPVDTTADATYQESATTRDVQIDNKQIPRLATVDESSGALRYAYPLTLPPGRGAIQPTLELAYSSTNRDNGSVAGYGWELSLPRIERSATWGTDTLYATTSVSSSIDGELVPQGGAEYVALTESGEKHSYTYDGTSWVMVDGQGTRYLFGKTAAARQDDPANAARVYRWQIEEIRDTNDNYVRFEYTKDAGQIYPKRIVYVGQGSVDGIYTVDVALESYTATPTLYASDFAVKTNYRIKQISVSSRGVWVRRYDLGYTTGDAGYRSMLATVTESAQKDGMVESRTPTTFTYQKRGPVGWQETSNGAYTLAEQTHNFQSTRPPRLMQFRDVNGDGYVDQLNNERILDGVCNHSDKNAYLNDARGGWFEQGACNQPWALPLYLLDRNIARLDSGVRIFDYDGDTYADLVQAAADHLPSATQEPQVVRTALYRNNAPIATGWTQVASTSMPIGFVFGEGMNADGATEIADVNGDGLPDIVYGWLDDDGYGFLGRTYLGDGTGIWQRADGPGKWEFPYHIIDENRSGAEYRAFTQVADINGDGLPDVLYGTTDSEGEYINNGHTWLPDRYDQWDIPFRTESVYSYSGASDGGIRSTDINGDGVVDFVRMVKSAGGPKCEAFINTLNEPETLSPFIKVSCDPIPEYFSDDGVSSKVMLLDINGDSMDDVVVHTYYASTRVHVKHTYLSTGTPFTDLLVGVQTSAGASLTATYKMSSKYVDAAGALRNPQLALLVPTVETLVLDDGMGTRTPTTYSYADGAYYYRGPHERKFAGFGAVTSVDAQGTLTTTYYHQGNANATSSLESEDAPAKIGKPYRIETRDKSGALQGVVVNRWGLVPRMGRAALVPLLTTTSLTYDGNATHRDTAVEYTYTPTGYRLSETAWGEVTAQSDGTFVDKGSDARVTIYTYATNTAEKYARRSMETVTALAGTVVAKTRRFFDNLPFGFIAKGNETRTERLLLLPATYVATQQTYNVYGLVTKSIDERGNATVYTPDAYNLYPAVVENALGHRTVLTYDYASGKVMSTVDPNTLRTETSYDAFDRVREVRVPDTADASRLVPKTSYTYVDTGMPRSVTQRDVLDDISAVVQTTYLDGFERPIQQRTQVAGGQYRVSDTRYDSLGRVVMQSLPYLSAGAARTQPTTSEALRTTTEYDALGRPLLVRTVLGTTRSSYDDWATYTTDPLGRVKALVTDAFGRLTTVVEQNAGNFYYTQYTWSPLDQLIKVTDAAKNVRSFGYDLLGRRISAEDLHAPADTTYGVWRYEYDAASNLTKSTSPRGVAIVYTYDALNRLKTEDASTVAGVEATYTYDTPATAARSIGKLSSVTTPQVTTGYAYDTQGRPAGMSRTYPGKSAQYFWHYLDRQGNPQYRYYPDASWVAYTYSPEGQLQTVAELEPGATTWGSLVSAVEYAPTGQASRLTYGAGVVPAASSTQASLLSGKVSLAVMPVPPARPRALLLAAASSTPSVASAYDSQQMYRLVSRTATLGTTTLQSLAYTYDAVGNIKTLDDTSLGRGAKAVVYGYDDLNRLTLASTTRSTYDVPYKQTYTYSPIGNILTRSGVQNLYQGLAGQSYANPHAPTFTAGLALTYDNDGNMLTWGTTYTNTWDYKGRLASTSYLAPSATTNVVAQYAYDHTGARVSATVGTAVTRYPFPEVSQTSTGSINTISAGDTIIATIERVGTAAPKTHYPLTDHLGSVGMVVSPTGAVEQSIDYFPFGQTRFNKTPKYDSPRTYLGEYGDTTALSYLNARYYDGRRGVFLSQDPMFWSLSKGLLADPQQMNSYSYARNNPMALKDPSGLSTTLVSGTWSTGLSDSKELRQNVSKSFEGQDIVTFKWSGEDNDDAREAAAHQLYDSIASTKAQHGPDDPVNVVCHSHGCNVVALYTGMSGAEHIDNLIAFGAPVRNDYKYNETNIANHLNIYSNFDLVQSNGGGGLIGSSIFGAGFGSSLGGPLGAAAGFVIGAGLGWMEFGTAQRTVVGAKNLDATRYTSLWHPIENHSQLYKSGEIWDNLVKASIQ